MALIYFFFFSRSFQSLYKPSPCSERRCQPGKISERTSARIHVPVKTTWSTMPLPVGLSWMTTNNLKTQDHQHWAESERRISVAGFRVMCWKQSNHKIQTRKGSKECLLIMTWTHNMLISVKSQRMQKHVTVTTMCTHYYSHGCFLVLLFCDCWYEVQWRSCFVPKSHAVDVYSSSCILPPAPCTLPPAPSDRFIDERVFCFQRCQGAGCRA